MNWISTAGIWNKTLRLLRASNQTLFELVLFADCVPGNCVCAGVPQYHAEYFSSKRRLSHYLSMASGNYREYLKGNMVKAKKYFYVLRPVLACRWILDKGSPPPMLFSELMEAELNPVLLPDVNRSLDLKMNAPEIKTIPKIESINRYLDSSLEEVRSRIVQLPGRHKSWVGGTGSTLPLTA